MACKLKVEPGADNLGWAVFIDHRPVFDFNRDLEALLNLGSGEHRLVVEVHGAGTDLSLEIDGGATRVSPAGGWPWALTVPKNKTAEKFVAIFSL